MEKEASNELTKIRNKIYKLKCEILALKKDEEKAKLELQECCTHVFQYWCGYDFRYYQCLNCRKCQDKIDDNDKLLN